MKRIYRITVNELLGILGTTENRKRLFELYRELRAIHTETVTIQRVNKKGLGHSLARLRKDSRILQREMAAKLRVTPGYLAQCESGMALLGIMETILFLHWCSKESKP